MEDQEGIAGLVEDLKKLIESDDDRKRRSQLEMYHSFLKTDQQIINHLIRASRLSLDRPNQSTLIKQALSHCLEETFAGSKDSWDVIEEALKIIRTSPELQELKESIVVTLVNLMKDNFVDSKVPDSQGRPIFVNTQRIIEELLTIWHSQGLVTNIVGCIHTPTPATPLCIIPEGAESAVHESMLSDQQRLYTVRSRAAIVRDFLTAGLKMFIVYPQEGRDKRTEEQLAIYDEECRKYSNLIDSPITNALPELISGATYKFHVKNHGWYAFAICACQANNPQEKGIWRLWFGPLSSPVVSLRVQEVTQFLQENNVNFQ